MRKHLPGLLAVVFLAVAIVFCALWQREKGNRDELELLGRHSAAAALDRFSDIRSEEDYWQGVADFRVFMQAYQMLSEDTHAANKFACARTYTALLYHPAEARAAFDKLTGALRLLAEDLYDENGFIHLTEFQNEVLR